MRISRAILLSALLSVAAAFDDETVPFFVRILYPDGVESPTAMCTDTEKQLIESAFIDDALTSYPKLLSTVTSHDSKLLTTSYSTTTLSRGGVRRSLTTNCARVCCEFAWGQCYHDYPECTGHPKPSDNCNDDDFNWQRKLTAVFREEVVNFDSKLGTSSTVTISDPTVDEDILEMCEKRKLQIVQKIVLERDEVSDECGNFLTYSVTLQCLWK